MRESAIPSRVAYTVDEACDAAGFTRTRLYAAITDGTLRSFKAGRRRMISANALEQFIEKLERESEAGRAAA